MKKITAMQLKMVGREIVNTGFSTRTYINYSGKCGCGEKISPRYCVETAEWLDCFESLPRGFQKTFFGSHEGSRFEYFLACSDKCLREMKGLIPKKSYGGKKEVECRGCKKDFTIDTKDVRQRNLKYCPKCRKDAVSDPKYILKKIEGEKIKNKEAEKRRIQGGSPGLGKRNGPVDRFK